MIVSFFLMVHLRASGSEANRRSALLVSGRSWDGHGTVAQASMFASMLPNNSFLDGIDARKGRWRDGAAQANGISHRELPMPISR
jgi:hypothetical protein